MKHCHYQGHEWREKLAIEGGRLITVLVCVECEQSRYPDKKEDE